MKLLAICVLLLSGVLADDTVDMYGRTKQDICDDPRFQCGRGLRCAPYASCREAYETGEWGACREQPWAWLHGCETDLADPSLCTYALVTGPCRAGHRRWGFDSTMGRCRFFVYGGCQGNGNRFASLAKCQQHCGR